MIEYQGFALDRFQEQAIRAVEAGHSVIVAAPTGAGKTLIAEYAIEKCLREGRRIVYTAPIKALSNQKFRDFTVRYGDRIGIKTGDVTINPAAPVSIMTTEIFRNTLFESPDAIAGVESVIFDEIHYLDDPERGTVWEESLIFAPPHVHFVCLSATVSNLDTFADWLRSIRSDPVDVIREESRPVPLEHLVHAPGKGILPLEEFERMDQGYREPRRRHGGGHEGGRNRGDDTRSRREILDAVHQRGWLPCLWFAFNRRECERLADQNRWRNLLAPAESAELAGLAGSLCRQYGIAGDPGARAIEALAARGISYHHAGMLPTVKEVVERLFTTGLVKLLFATETFALGVNMPARAVVFDTIHKFDGVRETFIKTREYHQMAGRAGRRGMDRAGTVVSRVEWPFVRSHTVRRIVSGRIEPIVSQFNVGYATLLSLYARLGERLFEACEKSFSNFTGTGSGRSLDGGGAHRPAYGEKARLLRRRLAVLHDLACLRDREITRKGRLAARIYGYELQVTELFVKGIFDGLDEDLLNVVFAAIVFEARRGTWYDPPTDVPRLGAVKKRSLRCVADVIRTELRHTVDPPVKHLDYRFSAVVHAWSRGCAFDDLRDRTSASDGDIVRSLRQTIQLLRQVAHAVEPEAPELAGRLRGALRKIRRDEVDAERQLRLIPGEVEDLDPTGAERGADEVGPGQGPDPEPGPDEVRDESKGPGPDEPGVESEKPGAGESGPRGESGTGPASGG